MGLFDLFGGKKKKPQRRPPLDLNESAAPADNQGGKTPSPPPDFIAGNMLTVFKQAYTRDIAPDRKGIHIETILSALGVMAGFGCQIAIREGLIKTGKLSEAQAFVVVTAKDGGTYYMGDQLNQPLLEAPMSVWNIVAGAAQHLGAPVPDIRDIARFVAGSLGGPDFGTLRVGAGHQPHEKPLDCLKKQWAAAYRLIKAQHGDPMFTGWYFALAAQQLIIEAKDVIAPTLAVQIVMEAAVAMAKVDPKVIGFEI